MASHMNAPAQVNSVLYFTRVGTKLGISDFVYTVQSVGFDITHVLSVASTYHDNSLLFYIEFIDNYAVTDYETHMPDNVLRSSRGAIYIPVDPTSGDHIVTLMGVKSRTTDQDILDVMSEYGDAKSVHRGFHVTGIHKIDNGKCYVVFAGQNTRQVPSVVVVNYVNIAVKYTGQYTGLTVMGQDSTPTTRYTPPLYHVCPPMTSNSPTGEQESIPLLKPSVCTHREVQTEPEIITPIKEQPVDTKAKNTRTIGTVTLLHGQVCISDSATNTDKIYITDIATQTMTLEAQVKEFRKSPRKKLIVLKKRKRAQSGEGMMKAAKSKDFNVHGIQRYFERKKPRLVGKFDCTSCKSCSVADPDFQFDFRPKMSMDTFACTACWQLDTATQSIRSMKSQLPSRTGEG